MTKNKLFAFRWFGVAIILVFAWYLGMFLLLAAVTGCENEPECVTGERRCEGAELYVCNPEKRWERWEDCRDFEDMSGLETGVWQCCTIDGEVNCFPPAWCDAAGMYCKTLDELQAYCEGGV